jgi:hypothetical protein
MPTKYPNGMRLTQWRRTPFRMGHRLLAFAINDAPGAHAPIGVAAVRAAVSITNAIGGAWSR